MGEVVELVAVLGEQPSDLDVRLVDQAVKLIVDQPLGFLGRGFARAGKQRPLWVARYPRDDLTPRQ